jgi:Fe-S-cluster-containing dehydrogenase component
LLDLALVACSRVLPRKVTIEKKDEINEYKKKRKRQKEERTSVHRPLSWNIYVKKQCRHINRAGCNNVCELID